jgi:hypothetical protein
MLLNSYDCFEYGDRVLSETSINHLKLERGTYDPVLDTLSKTFLSVSRKSV